MIMIMIIISFVITLITNCQNSNFHFQIQNIKILIQYMNNIHIYK